MQYHFTPVKTVIKKSTDNKCWQGCGEKGNILHVGRNVNQGRHLENSVEVPQKAKNRTST